MSDTRSALIVGHSTSTHREPLSRIGTVRVDRLAAHVFLALFLVTTFEPFVVVRTLPGSIQWGLVPIAGVVALALCPTDRLARTRLDLPLVAVAVWTTASLAWSSSFPVGWYLVRSELPALVLASLVVGTMRPRDVVRHLVILMGALAAWSVVVSIAWPTARTAIIGSVPNIDVIEGWRGTFLHKNLLGVFSVLGLATALCTSAFARRAPFVVVFVIAALGTRSATTGVGLLTVVTLWSWLTWIARFDHAGSRVVAKAASAVFLAVGLLASVITVPLFVQLYGKDLTLSGRTDIWAASWRAIGESPWVGHGVGSVWHDPFNPLTLRLRREITFDAAHAHNGALDVVLATGVVGLVVVAVFAVSLVGLAVRTLGDSSTVEYGRWVVVSLAAIVAMSASEPLFEPPALGFLAIAGAVAARSCTDISTAATVDRPSPSTS